VLVTTKQGGIISSNYPGREETNKYAALASSLYSDAVKRLNEDVKLLRINTNGKVNVTISSTPGSLFLLIAVKGLQLVSHE
jgi:predicted regulator of Ras-like GTPase activity (Roadblock/LC7/MglB family)